MSKQEGLGQIEPLNQKWRVVALAANVLVAWALFYFASGAVIPTGSGASVWFLAATAYWLLTLVTAPYFLPPRDSLTTAIAVVLLLAPLDFSSVQGFRGPLLFLNGFTVVLAIAVSVAALVAIFQQRSAAGQICYRISGVLGKGEVLLTPVVVISALGFYQNQPGWSFVIAAFWVFSVAIRPIELAIRIGRFLVGLGTQAPPLAPAGHVLRVDDPDIVRVALSGIETHWEPEVVHFAHLPNGKASYIIPLFSQMQDSLMVGTGLCCPTGDGKVPEATAGDVYELEAEDLSGQLGNALSGEAGVSKIVGIVVEGSSIASIKFQVVRGTSLEEGSVVFAFVRAKKIYYQVLDANTKEETFQQNPFGVQIVSATQLGSYSKERGFEKFSWLPSMNQPLFLAASEKVDKEELRENEFLVGTVPNTPFGVPVVLDDLIEFHTAVLGITGTGKTELALDIVRNALARDTKVFCVDFTDEYKARLADHKPEAIGLTIAQGSDLEKNLFAVETGTYGAPKEKETLKLFLDALKPQINKQVGDFLTSEEHHLGILGLAEITNTKATLRTTEMFLSAIMDWAKRNRKAERILIVLEEAHTIIPEAYSSGFDSETQWVVGRIGQIALQGRKYGVGLLLVSQRTALVSKTVLSQCNTYFTHALVDKTSLEYLGGVYSAEHIKAIPNLRFLEFVAQGKGIKSDRPLLARRNYDKSKVEASQALNVKRARGEAPLEAPVAPGAAK